MAQHMSFELNGKRIKYFAFTTRGADPTVIQTFTLPCGAWIEEFFGDHYVFRNESRESQIEGSGPTYEHVDLALAGLGYDFGMADIYDAFADEEADERERRERDYDLIDWDEQDRRAAEEERIEMWRNER